MKYLTAFLFVLTMFIINGFIFYQYMNYKLDQVNDLHKARMAKFKQDTEADFNKGLEENNKKYNDIFGFVKANWKLSPEELDRMISER